ncbi:hypothetical protein B296_00022552 [Ensete ventricosum]|uniref:Uncharacterized protein n=1 Tax=Ensete ventricosum TaxID=4639 RepID=A0A426XVU6_ENSVE|nr:hypothetical protein B296_00022552 [Ensete ventricosum]
MSLDNTFLFPYQPSLDWDPHTFQLGDLHQHFMLMGRWKLPIFFFFFGRFEHDSPTSLGDGNEQLRSLRYRRRPRQVTCKTQWRSGATSASGDAWLLRPRQMTRRRRRHKGSKIFFMQCKKSKAKTSVAYPFAVVKPGGAEGHVTLDDINARLLRRPRRPVRHPVGEYAYGPCVSPDGLGLSGKAVASLTRIQTRGRGTITIIRTKG